MVLIGTNIFGAALAFIAGAAVAALNYALSRYALTARPSRYLGTQIVRQIVQIAYLAILFMFGGHTPWDTVWLLAGGAFGVTLPMFYFTFRLVRLNNSIHAKEDSADG